MTFFDALIAQIQALGQPSGEVWFRGQADASWALIPWILRGNCPVGTEKNMLQRFRYRAMSMVPDYPADNDPGRWLFLMQHHAG
jgi:hypothetical protein